MTGDRRASDPFFWLLFAAGGVVSAMLMPVMIVLTGVAIPVGWLSEAGLLGAIRHPLSRLVLFVVVSLSLFHWAHRFRYALVDLGLGAVGRRAGLFYGLAGVGTVVAGWLFVRL
ncbi:MAG: fumarate reductase subunit FrdD [Actinomycetota bacterium]